MIPRWGWGKDHFDTKWNNLSLSAHRNGCSLEVAIGCTVNCRAKEIIYWEYSSLWRLFCYNWAVHCRHKHNLMKQLQLFKVDIYSQIQLYHQRIRARCCPWGKAAWTCSLLKGKPSFVEQEAHSTDKPLCPECWWLEHRRKILEIVAFMVCRLYGDDPANECHH